MPENLLNSIQYLKSVGPKRAESFAKINIKTIKDLLFYFPIRYLDRTKILTSINVVQFLKEGFSGEVTIIGQVLNTEFHHYHNKQVFNVTLKDTTGIFDCTWFNGAKYFKNVFQKDDYYAVSSKPSLTKNGRLQFVHPDFDHLAEAESKEFMNTGKIIPFYRLPKELRETNLGDFSLRRIIHQAVETFSGFLTESLPDFIINNNNLAGIIDTVRNMHSPQSNSLLESAINRLKFEELFYFECITALRKNSLNELKKKYVMKINPMPMKRFLKSLPFDLTKAQLKVLHEIRTDLESNKPMNRLLQGDVGSGKTIVAIISMLITVDNGFQAALMVPTEILADQHFKKISELVKPFGINVNLLVGGQKKSEKDQILQSIKEGKTKIIIGTHALIQENVSYYNIGLIVIDEQHRFGVLQRSKLATKGSNPDILIMTATPIPRTLTMTIYGDLDISIIDEMPKNRKPIKTYLRNDNNLPEIYNFIKEKVKSGYQTYLIYPLVEDSEKIDLKAAQTYFDELRINQLKELKLGLIHGRMKWQDKESVMLDFAAKKYDVLISTTVIEVGIDIPDANIIVINDAFRFGLSQLHQLRGRVGRSIKQAYCILIANNGMAIKSDRFNFNFEYLSPEQIEKNKIAIRLNSMVKFSNGFELSEIDLKLRGPGNIFGTQQSGITEFKYANVIEDIRLLVAAKEIAFDILVHDKNLKKPQNFVIKKNLEDNYSSYLQMANIA
jgi:ATP-dependent DNA helicase RecG